MACSIFSSNSSWAVLVLLPVDLYADGLSIWEEVCWANYTNNIVDTK
jgi:hypothetical protein